MTPLASSAPFAFYLAFIVFYFLRPQAHWPVLGAFRPTVVLLALLAVVLLAYSNQLKGRLATPIAKPLLAFIAYIFISLPFVEWPGSVLRHHVEPFVLVVSLFFLTVWIVDSPQRLRRAVDVFILCQLARVLDPLRLHLTQGYWGSGAHLGGGEFMERLAGAPWDVVNPNGLGFVCVTALAFVHYCWLVHGSAMKRIFAFAAQPTIVYVLLLTGSRSALIALLVVVIGMVMLSRRRALLLAVVGVGAAATLSVMNPMQLDRFRSIYDATAVNASTAQGRTDSVMNDFRLGLQRPILGTGLGTSPEARAHDGRRAKKSHNLYTEALIETGLIGLVLYCVFIFTMLRYSWRRLSEIRKATEADTRRPRDPLEGILRSMTVWLPMALVFSLAQYGITEWHWYLIGGLVVAATRSDGRPTDARPDAAVIGRAAPIRRSFGAARSRTMGESSFPKSGLGGSLRTHPTGRIRLGGVLAKSQ
ncbi:MAG: O-antigen ligase family protein [Steroidobacteraceae bacterium]|nr:O-antigen ligase family protein [Steroidobacteraceae bacterium]